MAANRRNGKSATQTVELERDAYERLEAARVSGESLSDVIKRCVRPAQAARDILKAMRQAPLTSATLQAIEESAARRRQTGHKTKG
jgi:predicted CopG family antitoxin